MQLGHPFFDQQKMMNMFDWLTSDRVRSNEGWILSWESEQNNGYPYPEVSGYMLHLLATWPYPLADFQQKWMIEIKNLISEAFISQRSLGRNGIQYAFDTAVGLSGLLEYAKSHGKIDKVAVRNGVDFILEALKEEKGVFQKNRWFEDEHWSLHFEPHLIKCLMALIRAKNYGIKLPDDYQLKIDKLLSYQRSDGAFALSNITHIDTHVHCYALEGLIFANQENNCYSNTIRNGVAWLAQVQNSNGGIPRDVLNESPLSHTRRQEPHSDVTAQAIRLFIIINPQKYADNIKRGLDFLSSIRNKNNVLSYSAYSNDQTTWSNMFACQMWLFSKGDAQISQLL